MMHDTYTTAEAAAAIEHGSFSTFRRNFYASGFNNLPLFKDAGRGQYAYGQIAEMSLFLAVQASKRREVAKGVVWGVVDALIAKQMAARKFDDAMADTLARQHEIVPQPDVCPAGLFPALLAPDAVFGSDTVSRDPDNRTWAIFSTHGADTGKAKVALLQEDAGLSLADIRKSAVDLETEGAVDERTRYLMELPALTPNLLDLTGTFNRFEENLKVRLAVRGR